MDIYYFKKLILPKFIYKLNAIPTTPKGHQNFLRKWTNLLLLEYLN